MVHSQIVTKRVGSRGLVILSEAKDHLATLNPLEMILRFAQDDKLVHFRITGDSSLNRGSR